MSFWGAKVKPGNTYTHIYSARRGRLRLTQATLGDEISNVELGKKDVVQLLCSVKKKDPVVLCALVPGQSESCQLELQFDEKCVVFHVLGTRTMHLAGYFATDLYEEDTGNSDTGSDSLEGLNSDSSWATFDGSDNDDDAKVIIPVPDGQMSAVVTNNDGESFHIPLFESKKSDDNSRDLRHQKRPVDKKRKMPAIRELTAENGRISKKKKSSKDKWVAMNSSKATTEEKEGK